MSLVQVTTDVWLRADTVVSVEVEAVNSEVGYLVVVSRECCDEIDPVECGEYTRIEAARKAARDLVQAVNDALRELA